jgi:hypothetical protein
MVSRPRGGEKKISKAEARFNRLYESQDRGVNSRSSGPSTVAEKPSHRPEAEAARAARKVAVARFGEKAVAKTEAQLAKGEVLPKNIYEATRVSRLRDRNLQKMKRESEKRKAWEASPAGQAFKKRDAENNARLEAEHKDLERRASSGDRAALKTLEDRARGGWDKEAREAAERGQVKVGGKFVSSRPGEPDLAHLARENKIPAKIADVPAGGRGAFTADLADATPAEYEKYRAEQQDIATKQAREHFKRERTETGEAPGGETGEMRKNLADDIRAERNRKRKAGGGSFDGAHPRHPAGTSKGGEFAPKKG